MVVGKRVDDIGLLLALKFVDIVSLKKGEILPALHQCKVLKDLAQEPQHFITGHGPTEEMI